MEITIYHNPKCSNSRKTLAYIQQTGIEPEIILYLQNPPTPAQLTTLLTDMSLTPRQLIRQKENIYQELALDNPNLNDAALIRAMAEHPILINRPIVTTPKGTLLCRPPELVLPLLTA